MTWVATTLIGVYGLTMAIVAIFMLASHFSGRIRHSIFGPDLPSLASPLHRRSPPVHVQDATRV